MALIPSVLSGSKDGAVRRSVNLNFYPPSVAARSDLWSGTGNSGGLMMARSLLWTSKKTTGTIRVYYLHATSTDTWVADVITNITSFVSGNMPGITMTITADRQGVNLSTLTLANYDTCLVSADSTPTAWGAQLNAFAASGGGIVLTTFANSSSVIPNFTYSTYSPITALPGNGLGSSPVLNTATIVAHPTTTGLSSLTFSGGTAGYGGNGTVINAIAQTVASYTAGSTLVAVQQVAL